jgi:hypothetical protein
MQTTLANMSGLTGRHSLGDQQKQRWSDARQIQGRNTTTDLPHFNNQLKYPLLDDPIFATLLPLFAPTPRQH